MTVRKGPPYKYRCTTQVVGEIHYLVEKMEGTPGAVHRPEEKEAQEAAC